MDLLCFVFQSRFVGVRLEFARPAVVEEFWLQSQPHSARNIHQIKRRVNLQLLFIDNNLSSQISIHFRE